mmetsp:Transcript_24981/g.54080  ORF Transcript_24981/g.54080 Transcript_24981/m.54080 type:complete len:430 (-) Transcript_24981:144-1433(-)
MASQTAISVLGNLILFVLILCLSASVKFANFKVQARNKYAIGTGMGLQFLILPFVGYVVVKIISLPPILGIPLLIVCSSPGGSYSNWFCSVFNADLALSVTMTAVSTILSVAFLPLNTFVYTLAAYDANVIGSLNLGGLAISLAVVVTAVTAGLFCSWKFGSERFRQYIRIVGNIAGVGLILFSVLAPDQGEMTLKGRGWQFYVAVPLPIVLGLVLSIVITSAARLKKPERVTVAIECGYQNTAIAINAVINTFQDDERGAALGVPLFYTLCQAILLTVACFSFWKAGWTKALARENFCAVLIHNYEDIHEEHGNIVNELVTSPRSTDDPHDLHLDVTFAEEEVEHKAEGDDGTSNRSFTSILRTSLQRLPSVSATMRSISKSSARSGQDVAIREEDNKDNDAESNSKREDDDESDNHVDEVDDEKNAS